MHHMVFVTERTLATELERERFKELLNIAHLGAI